MKKQRFILPRNVKYIISELNRCGFRADIVGGSVRDILLGRAPSDYDITTSATPEEMKAVFSSHRLIETGIKHGTVTVVIGGEQYEITTYRVDGEYTDNRRPDSVFFTENVEFDLARRDFTVNAMCYNDSDGFLDLFGGASDIADGIIRTVGDPEKRFTEDALRVLRALRFASTLDFKIEPKTASAARKCAHLLSNVSAERILTEWKKLIGGAGAYRIINEFSDIIVSVIPSLEKISLPEPEKFNAASPKLRELSLFATLEKPDKKYESSMRALKSDNKRRVFGTAVLSAAELDLNTEEAIVDSILSNGKNVTEAAVLLRLVLGRGTDEAFALCNKIMHSDICCSVSELAIDGEDLKRLGIVGSGIGLELERLLRLVAHGKIKNDFESLERIVAGK